MKTLFLTAVTSLLLFASCESVELLNIDYMRPAEVSFPASLRRVGIVNNIADVATEQQPGQLPALQGDAVCQSLSQELADRNYFSEVIICDSALRAANESPRPLSNEEVRRLSHDLGVDMLISLEAAPIRAQHKLEFIADWQAWRGLTEATVYPVVSLYLPGRNKPMVTLQSTDSIYWEGYGSTETEAKSQLVADSVIWREASDFAGTLPVEKLLPSWQKAVRHYFISNSPRLRDAAVLVRDDRWHEAVNIWKQEYDTHRSKDTKKKYYAAHNLALGYEMLDSLTTAQRWTGEAKRIAHILMDKNEDNRAYLQADSIYETQLKQRIDELTRLDAQMR